MNQLLVSLSQQLTVPDYTVPLAVSFEEQLLALLTMSLRSSAAEEPQKYKLECIALAKLLQFSNDAKR